MAAEPVLLDTDTLSELSRGNAVVAARARVYLAAFGRLTISAVTVFERLRGYRQAILAGRSFHAQLQAFEALVAHSVVLPFDESAADASAMIWSRSSRSQRRELGDILVAGIAIARQILTPKLTSSRPLTGTINVPLALAMSWWLNSTPLSIPS